MLIINLKKSLIRNKILFENFSYLTILHIFGSLVPIFVLPYLIRVLGKEKYGLVVYAQSIINYLVIFVNFGFNTLAIKEISVNRNNQIKINEIASSVFFSKGILFLLTFLILIIILNLFSSKFETQLLFYFSMWLCLYDFIFPIWYFQGIEQMKYITIITLAIRIFFLILVFIFINNENDYLIVPLINGIGAIIAGISGLYILVYKHNIKFFLPSFYLIKKYFQKSVNFFISEISIQLFSSSNKVIIGSVLGMTQLTYYDLAEKVLMVFRGVPLGIVRKTIYPRVAKTKDISLVGKVTKIMFLYSIVIFTLIQGLAEFIVVLIGGNGMIDSANILRLFSLIIITTNISNYYITVGLWSLGYDKVYRNLMIYSTILYLIIYLFIWIAKIISIYSIILAPIIVDFYLIIHVFIFFKKIRYKNEY